MEAVVIIYMKSGQKLTYMGKDAEMFIQNFNGFGGFGTLIIAREHGIDYIPKSSIEFVKYNEAREF